MKGARIDNSRLQKMTQEEIERFRENLVDPCIGCLLLENCSKICQEKYTELCSRKTDGLYKVVEF